jgi:hypothetical protein
MRLKALFAAVSTVLIISHLQGLGSHKIAAWMEGVAVIPEGAGPVNPAKLGFLVV